MNQWLADLFFALPRSLTAPHIFGSFCLAFLWLCYFFDIRPMVTRRVRKCCSEAYRREQLASFRARILYSAAYKKARLDEGGVYLLHLLSLLIMIVATILHAALFAFCLSGVSVATVVDGMALTVTVCTVGLLSLATQPRATLERRTRWGFHRLGSIVRVILREAIIVAIMFLWIYDAYFFPALI